MLWHTSMAPRRLKPCGEAAMPCAGRPGKEHPQTG